MNLNELRCVSAVARLGSFSAAAAKCFVTQPALSNAVARLEQELGQRIFARSTRKVSLTPFGAHILPYLDEVLRAHSCLKEQARSFVQPVQGQIRIGVSPLINVALLKTMMDSFRQQHRGVGITLHEMNLAELERKLGDGSLDFVFEVESSKRRSWQSMAAYREPLYFVPCGGHSPETCSGASVRVKDIAHETFVLVPGACGLADATRALFSRHRRRLREYAGDGVSCQVLEEWVALGLGAAILPASKLTPRHCQALPIADESGRHVEIVIAATWIDSESLPPWHAEFIQHMRDNASQIHNAAV